MGPITHNVSKDEAIRSSKDGFHTRKHSTEKESKMHGGENAPMKIKHPQNFDAEIIRF